MNGAKTMVKYYIHIIAWSSRMNSAKTMVKYYIHAIAWLLYSGHSLASVVEQAMRTFQNSKTLAGNMSMFWQVVLESVMTNFSKFKSFGGKYLYVVSLALGNSRSWRPYLQINHLLKKFLQDVLKVLTISDTGGRGMFIFQIYIAKLKSKTCFLMMVGLPL